ncbi:unnamed protein product [Effrenium voratum]|nr:unnamed protein product [Effrenium voratum]
MGCGASAAKVSSPEIKARAWTSTEDPELRRLLDEHGIAEQLPNLQSLGVSQPAHIGDLLVEDLEEAGLSRVQIRQLQRAVSRGPLSDSSYPAPLSPSRICAQPDVQQLSTLKESGQHCAKQCGHSIPGACHAEDHIIPEDEPKPAKQLPQPGPERLPDDRVPTDPPVARVASPSQDSQAAENIENEPPSNLANGVEKKPQPGKPPLYKNASSGALDANRPVKPAFSTESPKGRSSDVVGQPALSGLDRDSADLPAPADDMELDFSELQSESEADFDVTLLPELAQPTPSWRDPGQPLPEIRHATQQSEPTKPTKPMRRVEEPFGAGPQPSIEGPMPSSQLPPALRQRLEAREESRKAQQRKREGSTDRLEIHARGISPGRAAPREGSVQSRKSSPKREPSQTDVNRPGRQMFNKNELRAANRELFTDAIEKYQAKFAAANSDSATDECTLLPGCKPVQVYVRKRPLFSHEESKRNDFDVLSVLPGPSTHLVLHNCLFQADLRTPMVHHLRFAFDHVFSHEAGDEEVYRVAAAPLVESAKRGQTGTVLMFGQTGSGKTHTIKAIERLAAQSLFEGRASSASLTLVELRGARCFDLLAPQMPELRLRERQGVFAPEKAVELCLQSADDLIAAFQSARQRRATCATEANDESSRSHAVCVLRVGSGTLTLVDCAGTERRKDSANHTKERQQEGAEINASLHALKECVRFMSKRQRVPAHAFRGSALTKVLAASLSCPETLLSVICTVAPAASDTEHTLSTLRTGAALRPKAAGHDVDKEVLQTNATKRDPHPRQWSPHQVQSWLKQLQDGLFSDVCAAIPAEFTGQMLVRLSEGHCVQLCGSEGRGRLLFDLLHQAMRGADLARPQ